MSVVRRFLNAWFPDRRLDPDFPLALWFGGLWLYLKSFLYICYVYMIGTDEPPPSVMLTVEIAYFAVAWVPAFVIAARLWNEMRGAVAMAVVFLLIDTPVMVMHVFRLSSEGFLTSGLTKVLEFGSLGLNFLCVAWLVQYYAEGKISGSREHNPRTFSGK